MVVKCDSGEMVLAGELLKAFNNISRSRALVCPVGSGWWLTCSIASRMGLAVPGELDRTCR